MATNEQTRRRPIIGIAPDVVEPRPGSVRALCALTYADAVFAAGGMPVLLSPRVECLNEYLGLCDGFVLTGGDDPRTEAFGEPTHPKATPVHPARQAFDTALLEALSMRGDVPTLGVCLGMQMMALVAGGELDQHLPETLATHDRHYDNRVHPVVLEGRVLGLSSGQVTSHHRQAVRSAGRLAIAARSPDGVIEAIHDPTARFYLGVQWHPERTMDPAVGGEIFRRLVEVAGKK